MKKAKRLELKWNLINSAMAGALVFLGSVADGSITNQGIIASVAVSLIVALNKFRNWWSTQNPSKKKMQPMNFM